MPIVKLLAENKVSKASVMDTMGLNVFMYTLQMYGFWRHKGLHFKKIDLYNFRGSAKIMEFKHL